MRINHNIASLNTYRQLTQNTTSTSKSLEKLSSGLRINRAGDDAAGLAISEKMRGQIRGLDQASRNAQDGISLVQTAEGALNETHSILQRMRELAVQSATDTNTAGDRTKLQAEVDQLAKEITRISNTTEFNTQNLLAGGMNDTFHIGANQGQSVTLSISAMDAFSLGVATSANQVGTLTPLTTNLTAANFSSSGLGRGLSTQTYKIDVTHNAATTAEVSDTIGPNNTAISGTYTGDRNATLRVRADVVDGGNNVTAASYSTDAGITWQGATVAANAFTYQGTTITFTAAAGNTAGQTAEYTLNAANDVIQLRDAAGVAIGSTKTVYNDMTSVTIGDANTGRTIKMDNLGNLATASAVATLSVTSTASTAASFNTDGSLIAQANTVAGVDVTSQAAANTSITTINNALETVSAERSKLGALQNRLEHTINNLGTSSENLTASESRVRDVDMAKEMMEFTKNNILSQAAQAMLAQANQQPQGVLQLLR